MNEIGFPGIDRGPPAAAPGAAFEAGKLRDATPQPPGASFQDALRDAIRDADQLRGDAETAIARVAAGENESVADVMTAVEKADLAFRLLMQVRSKLTAAYEELMQMRI